MIIYEVNCLIDEDISETFNEWLTGHIREILALDGFISAETYQIQEDDQLSARENSVGISTRYYLEDHKALDNYMENHAERLRKEGKNRFAGQFSAYRRVLLKESDISL